jgi:hypothetical protein
MKIRTWSGKAMCIGAMMCVGGALVTTLYKGKKFYIGHHHIHHSIEISVVASHKTHMLRGTLCLIGSCCSFTAWFILQVCIYFPIFILFLFGLSSLSLRRVLTINFFNIIIIFIHRKIYEYIL